MHQIRFHQFCLRLALAAVMVFSLIGYHHHDDTHVCLGWEHLMFQDHCHKGISCFPNEASSHESSCNCHSGKILGMEKSHKQSVKQTDMRLSKIPFSLGLEELFPVSARPERPISYGNSPRGPDPDWFRIHGLRAPPFFVF